MSTLAPLTFSIQDLERLVSQRNYDQFFSRLQELLTYLDKGGMAIQQLKRLESGQVQATTGGLNPLHSLLSYEEKLDWVNRLAVAISSYLSDTSHEHSTKSLRILTLFKTSLSEIFFISSYGSMDHILFNRGLMNENYELQVRTAKDIEYLVACLSMQTKINLDYAMLMEASNEIGDLGHLAYLALLYMHEHPFGETAYDNLKKALDSQQALLTLNSNCDDYFIELMLNPWMGCSYWDVENRHQLKRTFNQMIQRWLNRKLSPGLKKRMAENAARTGKLKRIVVASEKYKSNHAMYRCYHQRMLSLRKEYELILVTAPEDYDEVSAKDFDRVIEITEGVKNITDTAKEVVKLEPDMIFYPSLGMAKWTILLSNLRIARCQVMAYGHPASAFSEHIDFGIAGGMPGGNVETYQPYLQENLVPIFQSERSYEPHPRYTSDMIRTPINDGVVRIAVNSSLSKIGSRFINLCRFVLQHSSVPVQFHFFMVHDRSWKNLAFEKFLRQRLGPNVVVHGPAPYEKYMGNLAQCDLAFGTFPFGGTNTNVDLMLLGIPKIFYTERSDFASFTDLHVIDAFELPEILHATSDANFIASAIFLIHNAPERERISKLILEQSPKDRLFSQKVAGEGTHYTQAFEWIFQQPSVTSEQNHV